MKVWHWDMRGFWDSTYVSVSLPVPRVCRLGESMLTTEGFRVLAAETGFWQAAEC